ncbi:hypothetical protein [Bradyrhizobium diazoefficiens]|uniref:hypothetical protein n=1 Tax=Bradyrhizobium diazoefficiens TaxID=1355477 RepID=UPI0007C5F3B5|nr:hypothetical protein [Bradyrhizobium diazoefficiens]AND90511.1 hypothetical protein AAV28_24015 [Bradyrhizobium diazoefficiens USDA 110]QBP24101.1 hypothetical protein Bdiaspc4_28055 [Bradyrhizobium diazoefficiens]BCF45241.1 hypothetical protein XF16B_57310 [Bradyrhizobium diazoefficiens]BCF71391.1 hypothetical protein XF19B_57440 [Bradyrhizobium diazoefficiens]
MTIVLPSDQPLSFSERHATKRSLAALSGEAALTVEEVCTTLRVSRAWLYSKAGRAVVGDGFKLGGSARCYAEGEQSGRDVPLNYLRSGNGAMPFACDADKLGSDDE